MDEFRIRNAGMLPPDFPHDPADAVALHGVAGPLWNSEAGSDAMSGAGFTFTGNAIYDPDGP